MARDVLVTSRSFGSVPSEVDSILAEESINIVRPGADGPFSDSEMYDLIDRFNVTAVIVGSDQVGEKTISTTSNLQIISKHGIGVDNIDLDAAEESGIVVTNTPNANTESVAELAFGAMFVLGRKLIIAHGDVQAGGWGKFIGNELLDKTLGIIGLGKIGERVAELALSVGMEVLFYDKVEKDFAGRTNVTAMDIPELLPRSDFVSVHCPLTPGTEGLVDREVFRKMKESAFLINTARGEVVDEGALRWALDHDQIQGAYLDVFTTEPPSKDSWVRGHNKVVLSPHIAAYTEEAIARMDEQSLLNVVRFFKGEPLCERVV